MLKLLTGQLKICFQIIWPHFSDHVLVDVFFQSGPAEIIVGRYRKRWRKETKPDNCWITLFVRARGPMLPDLQAWCCTQLPADEINELILDIIPSPPHCKRPGDLAAWTERVHDLCKHRSSRIIWPFCDHRFSIEWRPESSVTIGAKTAAGIQTTKRGLMCNSN